MRGSIDGLASSSPLGMMLPAVFADDDLAQRFIGGLDEVLAPILNVLDCQESYFSPALAPADFTRWLGWWIGAETDGIEDDRPEGEARLRAAVAAAAYLHRVRGTRFGLAETVRLAFGVEPEITESGGATWSARPRGPFPGAPRPGLHVTLRLPSPTPADEHRLDELVAAARPAHVPYTVQVTAAERTTQR
ncbi:phage tail protein [Streptomyces sp. NPDC005962]|uniref:phage tail protein n=1 Tax=Streptomyces sp. NPDC005962 TaxID=3154466 RepID=UPI003409656C